MADFAPIAVAPNLATPTAQPSAAELAKRADIRATAESFESSFLSVMLGQMFSLVQQSEPFGGGQGEAMFKSFMADAFAKQMTKSGGVGITDVVSKEMLKLQGLS
jgi:Rod binding domain-containing protein